jgi:hypothetical protein
MSIDYDIDGRVARIGAGGTPRLARMARSRTPEVTPDD